MDNYLRCTLCLEIIDEEIDETVIVEGRLRHKKCSETLEKMIDELEKIYEEDSK